MIIIHVVIVIKVLLYLIDTSHIGDLLSMLGKFSLINAILIFAEIFLFRTYFKNQNKKSTQQ